MKQVNITKTIDSLGRVLIPKNVRKEVDFKTDDEVDIFVENGRVVLEKRTKRCMVCTSQQQLLKLANEKFICKECREDIQRIEQT